MATTYHTDEKDLLLRLQGGDERAFADVYDQYSLTLHHIIMKMVHSEDAADDLLQDVFLRLWKYRKNIDPDKSFKGYLFITAKNTALKYLRHISIEKQVENYFAVTRSGQYSHVEESIQYKETNALLQQTLAKLPPQRRKVYALCKVQGMTYEQAASELGISTTTVRDHIVKANHFLKKELAGTNWAALSTAVILQYHLF